MKKNTLWTITVIVAIILIGGYLFLGNQPTVTAQGFSSIDASPDEVSVYLNIETKAQTAQEAQSKNLEISDSVQTALTNLGTESKDIQLQNYNIYPQYDYSNGQQTQKGYIASQQIVVKVKDFKLVPGIVDKSVEAGALVQTINFELSTEKQNEIKNIALKAASEDAKKKAEATASGLGKSLGSLVSVQSQDFYYPGPIAYYAKAENTGVAEAIGQARQAAASLAPRDIETTASVSVTYKLQAF